MCDERTRKKGGEEIRQWVLFVCLFVGLSVVFFFFKREMNFFFSKKEKGEKENVIIVYDARTW